MGSNDWSWNARESGQPLERKALIKKIKSRKPSLTKAQRKKKKKEAKLKLARSKFPEDFYNSRQWRKVRYQVLRKYSGECMCCGRSKKKHGIVLHVDHIKPRSKHPHLALEFKNLQLLCEDCNLGKSNIDDTDWRPEEEDESEIQIVLEANERI